MIKQWIMISSIVGGMLINNQILPTFGYRGCNVEMKDVVFVLSSTLGAGVLTRVCPAWINEHSLISAGALTLSQAVKVLKIHLNGKPLPTNRWLYLILFNGLFLSGKALGEVVRNIDTLEMCDTVKLRLAHFFGYN